MHTVTRTELGLLVVAGGVGIPVEASAQDNSPTGAARAWVGHADEAARYLEQAEIVELKAIGTGVTNPQRATLAPGRLVEAFAWKNKRPGFHSGF